MNTRKSTGESGDPYGTPLAATPLPRTPPSHATSNSLSDINLSNQGSQHRRGVHLSILASTSALQTIWKTPLTSQNAHPTEPPPFRLWLAFTTDLYRTSTAERPRTDPYCWWWRIELPSSYILSATTFSSSLPMQLMRLSGLQFLVCVRSRPGFGIMTTCIFATYSVCSPP